MEQGFLKNYFSGVASKILSSVEADTAKSNQHEFNGVTTLKLLFGESDQSQIETKYLWLGENEDILQTDGFLTWYDARRAHPKRSEYRLYFNGNDVTLNFKQGDAVIIAKLINGEAMVLAMPARSTAWRQLSWLFGLNYDGSQSFEYAKLDENQSNSLLYAARYILESIGIELAVPGTNWLDKLIEKFSGKFPSTAVFSAYARETCEGDAFDESPDQTILRWVEHEEMLFRQLEKYLLSDRLKAGFMVGNDVDVDGFLKFSLSVQNRRKSRIGYALEHHLRAILQSYNIRFDHGPMTENKNRPDFLFPGISEYKDPIFSESNLTMLGSKSTCKDRWRQVLSEANRIKKKHLFTLEPGISLAQTDEMKVQDLQLVIPEPLHQTYHDTQVQWLYSLQDFIKLTASRQEM